jgi:phosphatidylethanolamine-binding protein (PEBP) family uncharacterized protein
MSLGVRSFALLCDDPDAPAGTWRDRAIYDIPAGRTELAEDADRRAAREDFELAMNFDRPGSGGSARCDAVPFRGYQDCYF